MNKRWEGGRKSGGSKVDVEVEESESGKCKARHVSSVQDVTVERNMISRLRVRLNK